MLHIVYSSVGGMAGMRHGGIPPSVGWRACSTVLSFPSVGWRVCCAEVSLSVGGVAGMLRRGVSVRRWDGGHAAQRGVGTTVGWRACCAERCPSYCTPCCTGWVYTVPLLRPAARPWVHTAQHPPAAVHAAVQQRSRECTLERAVAELLVTDAPLTFTDVTVVQQHSYTSNRPWCGCSKSGGNSAQRCHPGYMKVLETVCSSFSLFSVLGVKGGNSGESSRNEQERRRNTVKTGMNSRRNPVKTGRKR